MTDSNLCLFCYKNFCIQSKRIFWKERKCVKYSDSGDDAAVDDVKIFLKILKRFSVGSKLKETEIAAFLSPLLQYNDKLLLGCCANCAQMVRKCCETYHQLRMAELQLEGTLINLLNIMKCAERVPSRRLQVQRVFENAGLNKLNATACCKVDNFRNEEGEISLLRIFKDARRNVIKKCSRKLSSLQPKVIVRRIEEPSEIKMKPSASSKRRLENDNPSMSISPLTLSSDDVFEIFFGWITSYAAVALLASMSVYPRPCMDKTNLPNKMTKADTFASSNNSASSANYIVDGSSKQNDIITVTLSDSDEDDNDPPWNAAAKNPVLETEIASNYTSQQGLSVDRDIDSALQKCQSISRKQRMRNSTKRVKYAMVSSVRNSAKSSIRKRVLAKTANRSNKFGSGREPQKTNNFECKICHKTFSSLDYLQGHKRKYHRGEETFVETTRNNFNCPVYHCALSFNTLGKLQAHRRFHGSFKCNFCNLIVEYAPDLAIHETEHAIRAESISFNGDIVTLSKSFSCSRCFRYFHKRKALYLKHFLQTHLDLTSDL